MEATAAADGACVLVPGDVRLGTTGVEIAGWLVASGMLIAAGVVTLLVVLLVRRRRSSSPVLAAALVALALVGLGQLTPAPAQAVADPSGCDLIGWSMLTSSPNGVEAVLSENPSDVVAFTLKNVSNVPISLQFRTDTKADPAGLAPFVEIAAACEQCSIPEVYRDLMGAPDPGQAVTLAGGESIEVRFSAKLLPGLGDDAQNTSATFGITAIARQI